MDSPIIVDKATKFGGGIDMDRGFPGFPFDDEGFGRRTDIRSHLDDLAARHPEFADQLLGPPWGDVPFPGGGGGDGGGGGSHLNRGNRNQRNPGNTTHNNHPEEDTRSQASSQGSGEPEPEAGRKCQQIPQYGLRNTLDIGQHQHSMENPQQQRNVRSMSAPPENRNNQPENMSSQQHPGQRFVSRVDITPQSQQPQPGQNPNQQREKSPAPSSQKSQSQFQQQQGGGNVRHIPIFVEGRDEPVIPRSVDEPDFPRRQQSPPQFHRPSHYQQHYEKHPTTDWSSPFPDSFFKRPASRWGGGRTSQTHQPESSQQTNQRPKQQPYGQPQSYAQPQSKQQQQQPHQQQQYYQPQYQNEAQPEPPPKPKQTQPKDPLEKVAMVQQEVDSLTEQVRQYSGGSRQDKQYMYLDEMLTRELIKLDDIDTEGKENVRQARKQAIKSIQDSIGLLESKAPLPGQQIQHQQQQQLNTTDETMESAAEDNKSSEAMETSEAPAPEEQKAIPLPPPSPPSPVKTVPEPQAQESLAQNVQDNQSTVIPIQETVQNVPETLPEPAGTQEPVDSPQEPVQIEKNEPSIEPMDSTAAPQVPQVNNNEMEVRQSSPDKELLLGQEQQKENQDPTVTEQQQQQISEPANSVLDSAPANITTEKTKKEPPPVPAKPNKSPKKAKKTKKQSEPVSETAIPLPAPGQI